MPEMDHQSLIDKVLRYGRDMGRSDTVRKGCGTRARARRWGRWTVRMDIFYADYAPVRGECLLLNNGVPVARYVSTDNTLNGLEMLYYDGIIVRTQRML